MRKLTHDDFLLLTVRESAVYIFIYTAFRERENIEKIRFPETGKISRSFRYFLSVILHKRRLPFKSALVVVNPEISVFFQPVPDRFFGHAEVLRKLRNTRFFVFLHRAEGSLK